MAYNREGKSLDRIRKESDAITEAMRKARGWGSFSTDKAVVVVDEILSRHFGDEADTNLREEMLDGMEQVVEIQDRGARAFARKFSR